MSVAMSCAPQMVDDVWKRQTQSIVLPSMMGLTLLQFAIHGGGGLVPP